MKVEINSGIKSHFPTLRIGYLLADVKVEIPDNTLREEISKVSLKVEERYTSEKIRNMPIIKITKNAYRKLGKDPNRYRPAAESLLRRVASGKGLYQVNNVIDILNLVSLQTGFSIGGYDADLIQGEVEFGIGKSEEPYEGIGRGVLNIENLPVFRDQLGAFGTPTSDSVRTMVTKHTKRFLMILPLFEPSNNALENALCISEKLLNNYTQVRNLTSWIE